MEGWRMFAPIWILSIRIRDFLRRYAPTNILLAAIHTRRGLKWGTLATLLAAPYTFAAVMCVGLVEGGAPGWVNLLVLLFLWNALKFVIVGPVSVIRLIHARAVEGRARRTAGIPVLSHGVALERV
jgi:hypothetical protein